MSTHKHQLFHKYTISVAASVQPCTDPKDIMFWIPTPLWTTVAIATSDFSAIRGFLQDLMNSNYPDLRTQLRKHGIDIKHFDQMIIKEALVHAMSCSPICMFIVSAKYKTNKERRVHEALGTLQMFQVIIRVLPAEDNKHF